MPQDLFKTLLVVFGDREGFWEGLPVVMFVEFMQSNKLTKSFYLNIPRISTTNRKYVQYKVLSLFGFVFTQYNTEKTSIFYQPNDYT